MPFFAGCAQQAHEPACESTRALILFGRVLRRGSLLTTKRFTFDTTPACGRRDFVQSPARSVLMLGTMRINASKCVTGVLAGFAAVAIAGAPNALGQATLDGGLATNDPICQNPDGSPCTAGPGGVTGGVPGGAAGAAGPEGAAGSIPGGPGGAAGPGGVTGTVPGGPTGTAGPGGVTGSVPGGPTGTAGPGGVVGSVPGGPTGTAGPGGVSGCIPGIGCI